MDLDDVDEDEHDARRIKPEEITVQFVMAFLQFALSLCLLQKNLEQRGMIEIQARIDRRTSTTNISKGLSDVSAEDDGGICKVCFQGDGWAMIEPYLALLEAKRAFQYIKFDERTGHNTLLMSNAVLAQYLGEAVIAWKERHKSLGQSIFLIAATNTFLRFIHFEFGSDYHEYIDTGSEKIQKRLIDDESKDTFVYIRSTEWFNLQSSVGRKSALCHILALVRWHEERSTPQSTRVAESDVAMENDSYY